MTFFKNLAVSLFSFLLFLSLAIFGLAFTLKSTALNPDFVTSELSRLEVSSLAEEFIYIETPTELPKLNETIYETISSIEPLVKEQLSSAIHSVYDYLLGETQNPDLVLVLRNTFLSSDFVSSLVDNIDISSLAGLFISQQFAEAIPVEIENLDEYIVDAIDASEPSLKEQIVAVSGPVFDYLLVESQTLKASISLEEVHGNLKDKLRQVFLDSPPPELATIPRNLREAYYNQFYREFSEEIPSTFQVDESVIGNEVPADIAEGLASAEEALQQARQYVDYFQLGYTLLLVFMALFVLGIILIIRNVKDITRRLGVPLITYGAIQYASIWVTKYLMRGHIPFPEMMPIYLKTWMFQFTDNMLKPLEMFSISLLIGGAVLTIISVVYRRGQS
ncbi:hypothetical protein ES703_21776 [subsurface metagenome]